MVVLIKQSNLINIMSHIYAVNSTDWGLTVKNEYKGYPPLIGLDGLEGNFW
jgi:hypothetical protein